jgi:hypothetical protein
MAGANGLKEEAVAQAMYLLRVINRSHEEEWMRKSRISTRYCLVSLANQLLECIQINLLEFLQMGCGAQGSKVRFSQDVLQYQ